MQALDSAPRTLVSSHCPFCSANGFHVDQETTASESDPFALGCLLAAGTLTVTIHDGQVPCTSGSDTWHPLPTRDLSCRPEDSLFRGLDFLTVNLFLRATCRLGASGRTVIIRVYLIPYDLPNVRGRLHSRHETVVKEARRHLHGILPLIEQSPALWDADETPLAATPKFFLSRDIDNRSMAEIYSELPSPVLHSVSDDPKQLSHHIASGKAIWGLRSNLYGYQRQSVAAMIQKETNTSPVPDPLYITVTCMSGTKYYLQPSTMSLLRECPMVASARGGILCEELGTGKTIMVLGLVLATIGQLPDPEESLVEHRPVLTPLAYQHFTFDECATARTRAGWKSKVPTAERRVPSLMELLLHYVRVSREVMDPREYEDKATHLLPLILGNTPFYHHYNAELAAQMLKISRSRRAPDLRPRVMYLTSATLVVVPLALLGQWDREIHKHCRSRVRALIVRPSTNLPGARELASEYDVSQCILGFRKESTRNKTENLHRLKPCSCPCFMDSRVPDCRCPGDDEVTPLLQIRWKRLVIDEGHTSGNIAATINYFARILTIERKWIVTGTPTSNILGLSLGRADGDQEEGFVDELATVSSSTALDSEGSNQRIWGQYDSQNLRKLGTMIGDFLAVPQFHFDPKNFGLHISTPLCDPRGPRPGAIDVLSQVMQMVMVRHRIGDVEKDIVLPSMKHDIIYMDLNEYALKSYNAMQASIVVNAIDSERKDLDYIFHPRRAKELQNAIDNLSQSLFWSASNILYNVDQICREADAFVARAIKHQMPQEDLDLLQEALRHAAVAAGDKLWRAMQHHEDVPFRVSGLDSNIFEAWTRATLDDCGREIDLMHSNRFTELRAVVRKRPLITKEKLVEEGNTLSRQERWRMHMAGKSSKSQEVTHTDQVKKMVKEVNGEIEVLKKRAELVHDSEAEHDAGSMNHATVAKVALSPSALPGAELLASSPWSGVRVGPSLSTKLNYILSEVLQYSTQEKFLIFSSSPLTLSHVAEGLSLFEIKYLRYIGGVQPALRDQCVMTFESSDTFRVFLMELKLGARGLNLISASRVIFCEPVWHPDVESQAIKRVHRMGQTRPVTVRTLVIRATAEEAMINRRQYLRSNDKIPNHDD
ncbi:P-loop containing nucleoside triphosphate hydrolase protein [Melanogaster broomeanus]|nr:P-loop containing nucleoside triphosphate hydrolase protein [Melanogaster broomeanus]